MHGMDILFLKGILYNRKFSYTADYLETNGVVVNKVNCITARFHRTDLVICSHSGEGKPCLIVK